jgi:hypothetical protein
MSTPQFWGADAPSTGAYKEHEVAEIFKPAGFAALLFQLAGKRRVMSGQSLTVPAYQNLSFPTSTVLDEDQTIPLSKLSVTAKTISMNERGRAVAITGKTENRSPWDILSGHKDAVATMMSRELEEVISTALKTMPVKYVASTSSTNSITTNGTPSGAAGSDVNIFHMQYIGNYLSDNLRVPMDPRYNAYVGIFRGNAILNIQRDSEYFELHRGRGLSAIENLRVGQIADCVLFKHNDSRVLSNSIGTSSIHSEGFVVGQEAVLFGFVEQIGLYYDFSKTKATDFGRFKYIAWLGDYGAGLYSDSANADLVRGLHVSST